LVDSYVWQTYLGEGLRFDPTYHEVARSDIVSFIGEPPGTVLDVGCAGGATGSLIKVKYPGTRVIGIELNADAAAHARHISTRSSPRISMRSTGRRTSATRRSGLYCCSTCWST